jgi:hypothetical protein
VNKRRAIGAAVVAIVISIAILIMGRGCNISMPIDKGNPESVAKAAALSLKSGDVDKVCGYFTGAAYDQMKAGLPVFFAQWSKIDVQNVNASLVSQGDTIAVVYLSYDLKVEAYGNPNTQHIAKKVQLIKIKDVWYLNQII